MVICPSHHQEPVGLPHRIVLYTTVWNSAIGACLCSGFVCLSFSNSFQS